MKINRRDFFKDITIAGLGILINGCNKPADNTNVDVKPRTLRSNTLKSGVFVVEGKNPRSMINSAIEEMGGMNLLIKKGDMVVIKPNMSWDRTPEQAANTNPELISELVKICLKSGAKTVKIFDRTCNEAKRSYRTSGIARAAEEAGAKVEYMSESLSQYTVVTAADAAELKKWSIYNDIMQADVVINVPILKHHDIAGLSISMKNLMGVLGGNRGLTHPVLYKKLSDFTRLIPVELVIVDACRILTKHGPTGGKLEDVRQENQIIVSTNTVTADAYAAKLFGFEPAELDFLKFAYDQGLGEIYPDKMNLKKIKV